MIFLTGIRWSVVETGFFVDQLGRYIRYVAVCRDSSFCMTSTSDFIIIGMRAFFSQVGFGFFGTGMMT